MQLSPAGLEWLKNREGCSLRAYQDAKGVWTIGYGITKGVQPGQVISQIEAERELEDMVSSVCLEISPMVTRQLKQNEFDALVGLAYNIGINEFAASDVLRNLNAGNQVDMALNWLTWDHLNKVENFGLLRRRKLELFYFFWNSTQV